MNGTDFVRTVHPVSYRLRLYITLMQCNAHKLRLCNATLINCAYAMQRSYTALMQCNAHKLSLCNATLINCAYAMPSVSLRAMIASAMVILPSPSRSAFGRYSAGMVSSCNA